MTILTSPVVLDWNDRPVVAVRSKGGVVALAKADDQLLKPDGIPWPPAPVVQKLYRSRQQLAFDGQAQDVLTARLGYYCDLQSLHSEDALTWNVFEAFVSAPESEGVRFGNWLLGQLEPDPEPYHTCEIDLWRRIPHPDSLVPGGPEIDFLVVGDRCVIFGEAKWRSAERKGQGLQGNKTQLQLRSEFLSQYGRQIYGDRRSSSFWLHSIRRKPRLLITHRSLSPGSHGSICAPTRSIPCMPRLTGIITGNGHTAGSSRYHQNRIPTSLKRGGQACPTLSTNPVT